jgi:hypothetical protein
MLYRHRFSEHAVRKVKRNQDWLKLNGTHQSQDEAEDVNFLGYNVNNIRQNTKTLISR